MMLVLLEVPLVCHVMQLVWNTPFINGPRTALPKKTHILLVSHHDYFFLVLTPSYTWS
jgi:hypothetical protein